MLRVPAPSPTTLMQVDLIAEAVVGKVTLRGASLALHVFVVIQYMCGERRQYLSGRWRCEGPWATMRNIP